MPKRPAVVDVSNVQEFTDQYFDSEDRLRLYYRSFGGPEDAPAVLCLHGLTRNSRDFESLAPHLARRYRVITPDFRGRARSAYDPNWANYHPGTYATDTIQLLDHAGITRCAIIGTSLGGLVGMIIGATHPQRLSGLILNDVGPVVDPRGVARIQSYAGKLPPVRTWNEAAEQARSINAHALPELDEEQWLLFAKRTYCEAEDGGLRPAVDPNISRAFVNPASSAPDLWPLFKSLTPIPMLVLRGESSDILSPETVARMQEIKPDLRVREVRNRGHAPTLDEADARSALDEFLAGLPFQAGEPIEH